MDTSPSSFNEVIDTQDYNKRVTTTETLHSVRKPPAKPWRKPVIPLAPKVYRVRPSDFLKTVQKLTGAPEFQSGPHQEVAPSALTAVRDTTNMAMPQPISRYNVPEPLELLGSRDRVSTAVRNEFPVESQSTPSFDMFSPSWHPWYSLPLMSPGSQAFSEQSSVL
ncbi:hypothetical protein AQUCO_06000073v1 [Aquilegia coerulea]|uniref:VQ domain-containing protein n=1 Tax=Aquilegia coerulea TaxID=218851 RepID=A0A2G5CDW0_AQUCA|nr:hypothetical protein AQUCO_06000073v1 [Aquilegia coerulea]